MRHACVVLFSAALALFLANGPSACAGERVLTLDNGVDATLTVPDGVTNAPAVLMLHGFGSQKNEVGDMYAREARTLADKGVASLRISFRGFGKGDRDTGSATIDQMVGDALWRATILPACRGSIAIGSAYSASASAVGSHSSRPRRSRTCSSRASPGRRSGTLSPTSRAGSARKRSTRRRPTGSLASTSAGERLRSRKGSSTA
jgi:hypothetical protein